MTNQYIVEAMNGFDLGLSATVMAHNDNEAMQLAMKDINDNHNMYLNLDDMQIVHLDRGYDGQHDVRIETGEGEWKQLFIDDQVVYSDYTILASRPMTELIKVCGDQFTFEEISGVTI